MAGSLSTRRFVAAARKYVPELVTGDVVPGPSGIRAQALDRSGALVDDFRITTRGAVTARRNAPSPGATSSLAIAEIPNAGVTTAVVENLSPATWYFGVKAYTTDGVESSFSNVANKQIN